MNDCGENIVEDEKSIDQLTGRTIEIVMEMGRKR